ncbi:MAG: hypothetical protein HN790_01855 [Methylococcales bacterium]|jgi:hypothetical protein|nr:hypothetical protein [Methylococcales bacterium]
MKNTLSMTLLLCMAPMYSYAINDPMMPQSGLVKTKKSNETPLQSQTATKSTIQPIVSSTIIHERYKAAIINGKLITVGAKVGQYKVNNIRDGQVVLTHKKTKLTLNVSQDIKKLSAPLEVTP